MSSGRRVERVAELIHREICWIVQELNDERMAGLLTITGVEISPDLRDARIYYSVLGDESVRGNCACALRENISRVRYEIGQRVKLRFVPAIRFYYDETIVRAARVAEILQEIEKENRPKKNGSKKRT